MSGRIRDHIRSNVVGYLALFFALGGGMAWATHPGGANTISSGDIINREVLASDIGLGEVKNGNLADDAVTSRTIKDATVRSVDVMDGSISGIDVKVPFDLSGADATAVIEATNSGAGNGVQGRTASGASGVYGENTGGGIGIAGRSNAAGGAAVFGEALGPGGRAGLFHGNVQMNGSLNVDGALTLNGSAPNFIQGNGKTMHNAIALTPNNCCNFGVLEDPGHFRVGYLCPDPITNNGVIRFGNKSNEEVNLFLDNGGSDPEYVQVGANNNVDRGANASGEGYTAQIHSPTQGITTIEVFTVNRAGLGSCHAQAQALITK